MYLVAQWLGGVFTSLVQYYLRERGGKFRRLQQPAAARPPQATHYYRYILFLKNLSLSLGFDPGISDRSLVQSDRGQVMDK
jgi:hypothetical protein